MSSNRSNLNEVPEDRSEDEVEVMGNGSLSNGNMRQQIRIYDFTQHPQLISSSLLPLNNSLSKLALVTSLKSSNENKIEYIIEDPDQVPIRPSVLYHSSSNFSLDDSNHVPSPRYAENPGGIFISLPPEEMFNAVNHQRLPTSEIKELTDVKSELHSMKSQQRETLDSVKLLREQASRSEQKQEGQTGQLDKLIETTDRLVGLQQELNRMLLTQQHMFDELEKRLSKVEESMKLPRGRGSTIIKPPEPQSEDPWEKPTLTCIGTFSGHESSVTCLVVHQNNLISGSSSGEIRIWDTMSLKCVMQACFTKDAISCMVLSEEHELLIVASESCSIFLINLTTMKIASFHDDAHKGCIFAMSTAEEHLFTSSLECIKIWRIEDHRIVYEHTLEGLSHNVRALLYDVKQGILYSGAHNSVHGWSPRRPFQLVSKLESKNLGTIFSLTATEDHLFVGTYNQSIHVLSKNTLHTVKILQSHIGAITTLITSPLEGHVISGSMDTSIVVWHTPILLAIQQLQRHRDTVNALAIVNDYLFSAGGDGEIKVFKVTHTQSPNQLV